MRRRRRGRRRARTSSSSRIAARAARRRRGDHRRRADAEQARTSTTTSSASSRRSCSCSPASRCSWRCSASTTRSRSSSPSAPASRRCCGRSARPGARCCWRRGRGARDRRDRVGRRARRRRRRSPPGSTALLDAAGSRLPDGLVIVLKATTCRSRSSSASSSPRSPSVAPAAPGVDACAPLAALRDVAIERSGTPARRAGVGSSPPARRRALTVGGAARVAAAGRPRALALLVGDGRARPGRRRSASRVLGCAARAVPRRDRSPRPAQRHAQPRRTAGTASALMVGVGGRHAVHGVRRVAQGVGRRATSPVVPRRPRHRSSGASAAPGSSPSCAGDRGDCPRWRVRRPGQRRRARSRATDAST